MTADVMTATALDIAIDRLNRYPNELARMHIHWGVAIEQESLLLQVAMPKRLKIEGYSLPEGAPINLPNISITDEDLVFQIDLSNLEDASKSGEIWIDARLDDLRFDHYVNFEASLLTKALDVIECSSARIAVKAEANYLRYLPELYRSDDLTSRLLMLTETFWKPIEEQIDQSEHYYDPELAPVEFLPWLSEWIGFPSTLDLPVARRRKLLRNAMILFQTRGTMKALKTFLEITTEGQVVVIERRANNFVIGKTAYLGMGTALGIHNRPDTISIDLSVPESELSVVSNDISRYRERVARSIQEFIPTHVSFDLKIRTFQA